MSNIKKEIDIVRYRSLSEQAFPVQAGDGVLKVCKARLYIAFGNGALSQATSTILRE